MSQKTTSLFYFCSFVLLISHSADAQTPGGISSKLRYWIEAGSSVYKNAGTVLATDGNSVQQWNNISTIVNFTASQSTTANRPTFSNSSSTQFNYNPTVSFNSANSNFMTGTGLIVPNGSDFETFIVSSNDASSAGKKFVFTLGEPVVTKGSPVSLVYGYSGPGSLMYSWWTDDFLQLTPNLSQGIQALHDFSYEATTSATKGTRSIFENGPQLLASSTNTTSSPATGFSMGENTNSNGQLFNGRLAEVVIYSANFNNSTSRNNIQSYLAIKYGITLSNSGGGSNGDYVSSASTNVWDASVNGGYHNQVIGLARDDNSGLKQLQSHQLDDSTRIYLSTLAASNTANTGTFGSDLQFLMVGNNADHLQDYQMMNTEFPKNKGIYSRIDREWKITNTNFNGSFSMDITLSIDPVATASDLRILIDDDGDFTNAVLFSPTISLNGSNVTISGISTSMIPMNTTKYLTLASMNPNSPLPIKLLSFDAVPIGNTTVKLDWESAHVETAARFNVERSADQTSWKTIDSFDENENLDGTSSYSCTDNEPLKGTSYYRLKEIDAEGNSFLSEIKIINISKMEKAPLTVYPNPTTSQIFIESTEPLHDALFIYDEIGRTIKVNIKRKILNEKKMQLDLSALPSGVYFLKMKSAFKTILKL